MNDDTDALDLLPETDPLGRGDVMEMGLVTCQITHICVLSWWEFEW